MTFIKFLSSKTFLKQLGIALVSLIIISFLILWWLRITTNHGQLIEVPNLAKMTVSQAEDALDELDLRYEVLDSLSYNPKFPYKTVIEQIPDAGRFVKEDRKIYISLNRSGYPTIIVPMVVGKTKRQAEPTLIAAGFKIGKITYRKYIARDEVLEIRYKDQKIELGDKLKKTSTIDLVLGDGKGSLNLSNSDDENQIEGSDDGNAGESSDVPNENVITDDGGN